MSLGVSGVASGDGLICSDWWWWVTRSREDGSGVVGCGEEKGEGLFFFFWVSRWERGSEGSSFACLEERRVFCVFSVMGVMGKKKRG